eukprot:SM000019S05008  [mRNA]  locus=s19:469867:471100:- [translate_table: standard]
MCGCASSKASLLPLEDGRWQLRSQNSLHSIHVIFRNATASPREYEVLSPGEECRQHTFVTHPWVFRDCHTRELLVVDKRLVYSAQEGDHMTVVCIQSPQLLSWSPASHSRFPRQFRCATKQLLLSHKRHSDRHGASSAEGEHVGSSCQGSEQKLGALPLDVLLLVVARSAPPVHDVLPVLKSR